MVSGQPYTFLMAAHPHFLVLATCDTKGEEGDWIRTRLKSIGASARLVDVGIFGPAKGNPDVLASEVFPDMQQLRQLPRGDAVDKMGAAVAAWIQNQEDGLFGVLAIGGSAGTTIGCQAMRSISDAIPKVMISTLASGDMDSFTQGKNIFMVDPLVDVAGINRVSRLAFDQGISKLLKLANVNVGLPELEPTEEKPLIAASMFGVTTPCVDEARRLIELKGFEVLVFHATGEGGRNMEKFIRQGHIAGVLDLTTTEIADELVGGVLSAGSTRLTAAGACHIPQVVSAGATDMVNFWAPDTVPSDFSDRLFHAHNAHVTLMRTTTEESRNIGRTIGDRISHSPETTVCLLPKRGVSALDSAGEIFENSAARAALFSELKRHAGETPCVELDLHLNDPAFAAVAVDFLSQMMLKKNDN